MSQQPRLIYLHGFRSSPQSQKVTELREWLAARDVPVELVTPELGFAPDEAVARVTSLVDEAGDRPVGLMGSSLGGYYATVVAARSGLPAVLVNPAVAPYRLLRGYLGVQENLYTGERFEVTETHMHQLSDMDPGPLAHPERFLVLLQTGDETLEFREAVTRYTGASQWIQPGGDHRFQDFPRVLPAALAFLGMGSF
ncbi:YqiA/YcfP family alpha/beta fold hydrolase [Marinobacter sp. JSM 1782161]|uniref:YqiA/YcfP family alpha/beta fold hydrolase n=1 Tax=Marinobacter sp. JSM 1782161 TaxID=2685906 RepID=UPI001401E3B3|nr:YqiA/YcfP family alpha/beta fold hydrolase [Marinobacter sp. JSM 1782161]